MRGFNLFLIKTCRFSAFAEFDCPLQKYKVRLRAKIDDIRREKTCSSLSCGKWIGVHTGIIIKVILMCAVCIRLRNCVQPVVSITMGLGRCCINEQVLKEVTNWTKFIHKCCILIFVVAFFNLFDLNVAHTYRQLHVLDNLNCFTSRSNVERFLFATCETFICN